MASPVELNRPEVHDEVTQAFVAYDAALHAHDVETLNNFFVPGPLSTRFGLGQELYGSDEIVTQLSTQTWTANTTGRTVTVDVLELFQITDGRISEIRVFQQDTYALLETLETLAGR